MNITTFNDTLEEEFAVSIDGARRPWVLAPILNSPLFYYESDDATRSVETANAIVSELRALNGTINLPFPKFRIFEHARLVSDGKPETFDTHWWIERAPNKSIGCIGHAFLPKVGFAAIWNLVFEGTKFGATLRKPGSPKVEEMNQDLSQKACANFLAFLFEVNNPTNFIASVTPDKAGKSVEWLRARTHYVILNRSHPANRADVKVGGSISENGKALQRQAHTRRAHYRILRSPRFREKVGKKIWVKSAWVGPKEWKQAASIYKIIDRAA